ncbi:MAG TPA: hypothetical protein VIT88_00925 [Pyrinomonadaceae bacterium]
MRILSLALIVVAALFGALLVTHSVWLFGLYVAAASGSLLLMWFWHAREAPVAATGSEHQVLNNEQPKTTERPLDTATDDPTTGVPPIEAPPPSPAAMKRRFWIRLLVVVLSPLLTFLIVGVVSRLESRLPEFVAMIAFLLIPATWFVLLWGLASLSKILLFGRSQTQFPPWSMLFGVLTTFSLILCALTPLGLLAMGGGCSMSKVRIPPNAFDVKQRIEFRLEGNDPVSEEYHIEPKKHYAIESVSEVESGSIKSAQIEMFESGKFQDRPLQTMQLECKRPLSAETQSIGWFRSKITFKPPDVTLLVKDLRVYVDGEVPDTISKLEEFPASRATNFQSEIKIELPKNAFLASSPEGKLIALLDKDVLTLSLSKHESVELYYLRRARFKPVVSILGQSSNYDLLIAFLAFAFWPVALILVGKFHQKLADRIVGVISVVFRKKPTPRTVGFTPGGK